LGKTVQVIPHVTNESRAVRRVSTRPTVRRSTLVIVEIGGTVGEYRIVPFLEAIRQLRHELGRENTLFMHVDAGPWIAARGRTETKPHPAQRGKSCGRLVFSPDILMCRSERDLFRI